jgi:hypothetical protein
MAANHIRVSIEKAGVTRQPRDQCDFTVCRSTWAAAIARPDFTGTVTWPRHMVMPVLFRTVYACGLCVCEALLLRPGHVDTAGSGSSSVPPPAGP